MTDIIKAWQLFIEEMVDFFGQPLWILINIYLFICFCFSIYIVCKIIKFLGR